MSKVAAIQMASAPQRDANLIEAGRLIQLAKDQGAELVVLPENFPIMGVNESDKVDIREPYKNGPIQTFIPNINMGDVKNIACWVSLHSTQLTPALIRPSFSMILPIFPL